MRYLRNTLLTILLGFSLLLPAAAGEDQGQHRARRALAAGEIVSLEKILAAAEAGFEGEIVEVELERKGNRWEYEIEMLTSDGNVLELKFDAATARLLEVEGSGIEAARKKP